MLTRLHRALVALIFEPQSVEQVPIELKGLNFYVDPTEDPFIPIGGVLLVKGMTEDRGVYYREYHTRDLTKIERYGMCQSAADSLGSDLVQTQQPGAT